MKFPQSSDGYISFVRQLSHHRHSHQHAGLEFNLVIEGCGAYIIEGRRHELSPHAIIWLFPRQEHVLVDFSEDFVMWVVVFRTRLVRNLCHSDSRRVLRKMNPPGNFCRLLSPSSAEKLSRLLALIAEETDPATFNAGVGHLLLKTWDLFENAQAVESATALHPAVDKAIRLLRGDNPPHSVVELADAIGVSPTYLSRLFLRQVGLPLSQFRNQERIRRFLAMAEASPDETMLHLALKAGFGSYAQFHRVFRQCMHVSPNQWAQNRKNIPLQNDSLQSRGQRAKLLPNTGVRHFNH
ncbi:MAG: helix-turn-helix domain-containing protein [Phycisphaerae bacterium]|nr:helix-turn-helix domain-containing protein [Phycisphaerae bacterium]